MGWGVQEEAIVYAFCQGILLDDDIAILRPPFGNPEADPQENWLLQKTLYGLCRSPCHWDDKINAVLISIGVTPSLGDRCLYSGLIAIPLIPMVQHWPPLSHWASMWMTLSISRRTWWLNLCSVDHWLNTVRLILWASSNGSLTFTSLGISHCRQWRCISANRASRQI